MHNRFTGFIKTHTVLIAIIIPLLIYPALVAYDLSAAETLQHDPSLYPLNLTYRINSDQRVLATLQFAILYNVSYTLRAHSEDNVVLSNYSYDREEVFYVKPENVNKTLYDKLLIDRDEMYRLLLLDQPGLYFLGKDKLNDLINSPDTIGVRIGDNVIQHRYIIIGNIVLIYRTTDIEKINWLGNTSYSIIITRAARLGRDGEVPTNIDDYNLTIYYLKYSGLALQVIYNCRYTGQSLGFTLEGAHNMDVKKYLLLSSLYERIVDVDTGKFIAFNLVLFFITIITWSIMIGYFENKKYTRKSWVIGLFGLLVALTTYIAAVMFNAYQYLPLLYIGLATALAPIVLLVSKGEERNKLLHPGLLCVSTLIVLGLYSFLIILWFPGSIFKIGLETGLMNQTETNITIQTLLARGIEPLLFSKEYAYYYIFTGLYIQLPALLAASSITVFVVEAFRSSKKYTILLIVLLMPFIVMVLPGLRLEIGKKIILEGIIENIESNSILSLQLLTSNPELIIGVLATSLFFIPLVILYPYLYGGIKEES